jgi:hypothetical protein
MDGELPLSQKRVLRAHLRQCPECARLARSQRAKQKTLKGLLAVPLPQSLQSLFPHAGVEATAAAASAGSTLTAGGGIGASAGLATKAAAVLVAGTLLGGGTYEAVTHTTALRATSRSHHAQASHPTASVSRTSPPTATRAHFAAVISKTTHRSAGPHLRHLEHPNMSARPSRHGRLVGAERVRREHIGQTLRRPATAFRKQQADRSRTYAKRASTHATTRRRRQTTHAPVRAANRKTTTWAKHSQQHPAKPTEPGATGAAHQHTFTISRSQPRTSKSNTGRATQHTPRTH